MEQSLLCKIPRGKNSHFSDEWANGAMGTIQDRKGTGIYRFYKGHIGSNGMAQFEKPKDEEDAPIVASGIVAYWLHYGIIPNRPTGFGESQPKPALEVFKGYTQEKLNEYERMCDLKISSWRMDLEHDFYTQYIIPYEKRLIKQSEALLEYITPEDQQMVRDVMKEYILYLQQIRDTYQPSIAKPKPEKKPEKVRAVDIETIGNHFKRGFDKTTHLPTLKLFLEQPQSDKELARVALLIYNSPSFIRGDYHVFSKWYKDFCRLVGCDFHCSFEPNKLKPSEELKNKYYFLL